MDPRRLFNEINALKRRVKNLNGETFSNNLTITGDVGIGTTSPDYELDVAGDIGINEYLYHNGDEDTHIRFQNNNVNIVAGGKSAIKLDTSTGKIQINNTNENLDVQIMADNGNVILHTDAGTNRVGIGTSAPEAYLDIRNTTDDGTTNRTMLRLHNDRSDDADVNDFGPISIDFVIENLGGGAKEGLARIAAVSSPAGTDHDSILGEKTSGLIFSTMNDNTLAEAMRINHSGYLGIGTTSPATKLHVKGSAGSGISVIKLEQLDADEPFIRFEGTSSSDQTKSLSTDTSVGSLTGHIRVSINGTDFWVPYYATN